METVFTMTSRAIKQGARGKGKKPVKPPWIAQSLKEVDAAISTTLVLEMGATLFGKIGDLLYFLYDACRPGEGADPLSSIDGASVSFDKFCESITDTEIQAALMVGIDAVIKFFPQGEAKGEEPSADPQSSAPGPGEMSTS